MGDSGQFEVDSDFTTFTEKDMIAQSIAQSKSAARSPMLTEQWMKTISRIKIRGTTMEASLAATHPAVELTSELQAPNLFLHAVFSNDDSAHFEITKIDGSASTVASGADFVNKCMGPK